MYKDTVELVAVGVPLRLFEWTGSLRRTADACNAFKSVHHRAPRSLVADCCYKRRIHTWASRRPTVLGFACVRLPGHSACCDFIGCLCSVKRSRLFRKRIERPSKDDESMLLLPRHPSCTHTLEIRPQCFCDRYSRPSTKLTPLAACHESPEFPLFSVHAFIFLLL